MSMDAIQNRAGRIKEALHLPSFRESSSNRAAHNSLSPNHPRRVAAMRGMALDPSMEISFERASSHVDDQSVASNMTNTNNNNTNDNVPNEEQPEDETSLAGSVMTEASTMAATDRKPAAVINLKNAKRCIEDDLVCPITLELPYEPVTAEDGRIYERTEIERFFQSQGNTVSSPVTNQKMGKKLLSAPQIKSHIELLLDMDLVAPDLAAKWREREQQEKDKKSLLEQAEEGVVEAMEKVAYNFRYGGACFRKDTHKAFEWYGKAHKAGSTLGTARFGEYLVKGIGVKRNIPKGFIYLTMVASKGSDIAAYVLGMCMAEGLYGVEVDLEEGKHWLEKVTNEENNLHHEHGDHENRRKRAQDKLDELMEAEDTTDD